MKRRRSSGESEPNPSPFKRPKLRSSTTPPLPSVSLEDIPNFLNGQDDIDEIDLFSPITGLATWTGERGQNQDTFHIDKSYDPQQIKNILENTDVTKLKKLCVVAQDDTENKTNKSIYIIGVFDGHGSLGDLGSKLACSLIPTYIHQLCPPLTLKENQICDSIKESIKKTQNQLLEQAKTKAIQEQEYGTTANIAILWNNNLTVANGKNRKNF